jgi:hypothetical membrane protein
MRNIKIIGLISYLIIIITIIICNLIAPEISHSSNFALSDYGVNLSTALLFNPGLITSGIVYLIFTIKIQINKLQLITGALTGIFLSLIGFIPYNLNLNLHIISTLLFLISNILSLFFLSKELKVKRSKNIIYFQILLLAISTLILIWVKPIALMELVYLASSFIIYLSYI